MHLPDLVEIVGALLILAGFAGAQLRRLDPHRLPYLVLNLVGAAVLSVLAAVDRDWGFLLLEGVWTAVSAASLAGLLRRRRAPARGGAAGGAATGGPGAA
ncbi:MAG TPA: hypothetical protein VFM55_13720 [Micromonosporaceae bacterium]|nr:hypothetical protein [Micromonosporaceae bacterium]